MSLMSGWMNSVMSGVMMLIFIIIAWISGKKCGQKLERNKLSLDEYRNNLRQQKIVLEELSDSMEDLQDVQGENANLSDVDARRRLRESVFHNGTDK